MRPELLERFLPKIVADDAGGCLIWTAFRDPAGYGQFWIGHRMARAHRVAYEHWRGPIPDGLVLDHVCRVRSCVNPWHLRAVTDKENIFSPQSQCLAAINVAKTHCPHGHPLYGDNLHIAPSGQRKCRTCGREQRRRYRLQPTAGSQLRDLARLAMSTNH